LEFEPDLHAVCAHASVSRGLAPQADGHAWKSNLIWDCIN